MLEMNFYDLKMASFGYAIALLFNISNEHMPLELRIVMEGVFRIA